MLNKAQQLSCSAPIVLSTPAPVTACCRSRRRADTLRRSAAAQLSASLVPSVDVQGLQVQFGSQDDRRTVIQGVDLTVEPGTLHMLLGPNGCGKSTLLKVLGGLVPYTRGMVNVQQPTGFVFQNPDHQVVMPTVAADVAFGLGRYDLKEEEVQKAVVAALELVNMRDYMFRATHTLSGGQRQRVAIAGALAENPRVLLLDELTTFLDVEDQFGVLSAVKNITRQGITRLAPSGSQASGQQGGQAASSQASAGQQAANNGTSPGPAIHVSAMWVTHRFEELEYADSASYMKEGKIIFTGGPEEMRAFLRKEGAAV